MISHSCIVWVKHSCNSQMRKKRKRKERKTYKDRNVETIQCNTFFLLMVLAHSFQSTIAFMLAQPFSP